VRDPKKADEFEYNQNTAVYHKKGANINAHGRKPIHFYFDEAMGEWVLKPVKKTEKSYIKYSNGKRYAHLMRRNKRQLTPDDYVFCTDTGEFQEKDESKHPQPEDYVFDTTYGVWKYANVPEGTEVSTTLPDDYFFDDEEGTFIHKKEITEGELYLDLNHKIWRKKLRIPQDYYWDTKVNKYVKKPPKTVVFSLKPAVMNKKKKKPKEKEVVEKSKDPIEPTPPKDYERPWLDTHPYFAADEERYEKALIRMTLSMKEKEAKLAAKAKAEKLAAENTEESTVAVATKSKPKQKNVITISRTSSNTSVTSKTVNVNDQKISLKDEKDTRKVVQKPMSGDDGIQVLKGPIASSVQKPASSIAVSKKRSSTSSAKKRRGTVFHFAKKNEEA